jgi:mono/diheme cytochrome c family protein
MDGKEKHVKKNVIVLLAVGFFLFAGIQYQAFAEEHGDKQDGQQLFEANCKRCHPIERPRSKRKTREEWETTVMRMKNRNGCPISDEEAALIIDHLAQEYGPE